jgi:hypothetical protein
LQRADLLLVDEFDVCQLDGEFACLLAEQLGLEEQSLLKLRREKFLGLG